MSTTGVIPRELPTICFVVGPPGAGKGTLCDRFAKEFGVHHLSVGDFLRDQSENGGWDDVISRDSLKDYLQKRELIPSSVMAKLLSLEIFKLDVEGAKFILIDGFPRSASCAKSFDGLPYRPSSMIQFLCPKDVVKHRFLARRRGDDDAAVFEQRWMQFTTSEAEVTEYYRQFDTFPIKTCQTELSVESAYHNFYSTIAELYPTLFLESSYPMSERFTIADRTR